MATCEHCGAEHGDGVRFCPSGGGLIASSLLPTGSLLEGKYRIKRVIGVGGMGAVFEATHEMLGHRVAVKVMLPELSTNQEMSSRLIREGRAASATGHPNIAMVTDMGWTDGGGVFVVMEYIDGRNLADVLDAEGPFDVARAAKVICQVLAGLEAVHRSSIVHRDLKPENVMLVRRDDEDRIKILDFGISKMSDDGAQMKLTATGMVMGTPHYMAPEQAKGASTVDHRADLYSAGAILYRMLTGEPPITAETLAVLLARLIEGAIEPPSTRRPGLPAALDKLVMRALALKPEQRFSDARTFRKAIEPFCSAGNETAAAATPPAPSPVPAFTVPDSLDEMALVTLDDARNPTPQPVAPTPTGPNTMEGLMGNAVAESSPPPPAATGALPDSAFAPPGSETGGAPAALQLDRSPRHSAPSPAARTPTAPPRAETRSDTTARRSPPPAEDAGEQPGRSARKRSARSFPLWIVLAVAAVGAGIYYLAGDTPRAPISNELQAVEVHLTLDPPGAEVSVDGVRQVGNPIRLPRSGRSFTVRVESAGYLAQEFTVTPSHDQKLVVSLSKRGGRDREE